MTLADDSLQNHSGVTGPSLVEFKNLQIMDL